MFVALIIVNILLAIPFALIGGIKLFGSPTKIDQMFKASGKEAVRLRLIGLVEIVGVLGLFLPILSGVLPWLTPLAAVGLLVIMILAIRVHRAREEAITINLVLGALAVASAVLGTLVVLA